MDYKEHIEHAMEYIETNLMSELSLTDLAKAAGYSEYHSMNKPSVILSTVYNVVHKDNTIFYLKE